MSTISPLGQSTRADLQRDLGVVLGDGFRSLRNRRPNPYASSAASEIIRVEHCSGSELELLVKYGREAEHDPIEHRFGISYEAAIYQRLLHPLGFVTPRAYGLVGRDAGARLFLEYIDGALRLSKAGCAEVVGAARWIGRFHRLAQHAAGAGVVRPLDERHCVEWIARAVRRCSALPGLGTWFREVANRVLDNAALLVDDATCVHGEFYPANILWRAGTVFPIDWECAARATGEVDLACLTDRWPASVQRDCERAYALARWPTGAPGTHPAKLALARCHVQLRWLGARSDPLNDREHDRIARLSTAAKSLREVLP